MKKYGILFLMLICFAFGGLKDVKAVPNTEETDGGSSTNCSYGVICQYEFCSYVGDSGDGQCDNNIENVVVQVAYRCAGSDTSASSCSKFTSQQGGCMSNGDGEGALSKLNFTINGIDSEVMSGDSVYCYDHSLDQNGLLDNDKYNECLKDTASIPTNTFMNHFKKKGYTCPALKISGSGTSFSGSYSSSSSNIVRGVSVGCVSRGAQNLDPEGEACKEAEHMISDSLHQQFDEVKDEAGLNGDIVDITKIKEWAENAGYDIDSLGDPCTIISPSLKNLLTSAFWIISVGGIILVVVMTAISFIKAIVGSEDDKFRDAIKHLYTRIIVIIILLLLPMILTFIINLINNAVGEGKVSIGSNGNDVFCDISN